MSIDLEQADRTGTYLVTVEDDDRVAHAYLRGHDGKILSTVWLYNSPGVAVPKTWGDYGDLKRGDTPLNVAECGGDTYFAPIVDPGEVKLYFLYDDDGGLVNVKIYVRGEPHAVLVIGERFGWSALATRDGPVAHVLGREQVDVGYWALTYNELRDPAIVGRLPSSS
jgi:hypothetical protein